MKEKVGILTINDDSNCGNRLQNYAVQEILKNYNVKPVTIVNLVNSNDNNYLKTRIKRLIRVAFLWPLPKYQKAICFDKFNLKIKKSLKAIKNKKDGEKLQKKYKTFFVGSDQVWNPYFSRTSSIDFLTFAPKKKRNSFSASFGINDIPSEKKEEYRKMLLEMNNISVREERGKKIIEEITGRTDVEVLLDPTMLLQTEKWEKLMVKPKQLKKIKGKQYILNYFLGDLSDARKKEIQRVAKENNCEIINLLDKNDPFYDCGPNEFIYLERNAFLICTDSFHSSVFAILFNRPFIIFDREDLNTKMNSRIDTLLNKFDLQNRRFSDRIKYEQLSSHYNINEILEKERVKAKMFIEKAF